MTPPSPTSRPPSSPELARIEAAIAGGDVQPLYLVSGDLVVAEPAAGRLATLLAERAGTTVERHRRPADLSPILADLRTYSLFATAKVALVVDSALLADRAVAADLVDQAAEAVPFDPPDDGELSPAQREAASRLLQALRVFAVDAGRGAAADAVEALPDWAFAGGAAMRKRKPRGRSKKEAGELKKGLAALLEAARAGGMQGFAEGVLAELGAVAESGLPPGHVLVLAEHGVDADHPLARTLAARGAVVRLGTVGVGKGGEWLGLEALLAELEGETGVGIDRDAVRALAERTLRQSGDFRNKTVEAESTARFAAEYRKLAAQVGRGRIGRAEVESGVEDRGEEDVWQLLDAVGEGRGDEALERYRRLVAAADDALAERLRFFGLFAGFCRQLTAVGGLLRLHDVPRDLRNYNQFKSRWAPRLQGALPDGATNPVAKLHPFRLFRAYQAAARRPEDFLAGLPWLVLETELRLKGDSTEADAALGQLIGRVTTAGRRR